jgi:hypothetical protein
MLLRKKSPTRKCRQWSTQIYHQLFVQCLTVKVCLIQNAPPGSSSPDFDEEEKNTPKETPQPFTSRHPKSFLNITSAEPQKITQKELSDLIRDLQIQRITKNRCLQEFQQWNLLDNNVKVTAFCSRQKDFKQFFITKVTSVLVRESRV